MSDRFRGVFVALATPMDEGEEIDFPNLHRFVDYLITEGGVHGLIPLGSTGEYYALDDAEKDDVVKAVVETAGGRVPVLVGTNSGSTRRVIDLSQRAVHLGAAGVLLAPPYYSLPTPDELLAHFRSVNHELDVPIMLYNYPARTGVDLTPDLVSELADLKNVRYIKESTGESGRVSEIIAGCGDRLDVFCGSDAISFESLQLGAVGWVAGVANAIPKEHVKLYELTRDSRNFDAARDLFYKMLPLLQCMEAGGKYTQFVKAACAHCGNPIGPPRRPLLPATKKESDRLAQLIQALK